MEYKIKRGDTLSELAKRYGTTAQTLAALNSITNPDRILAGDVITIPRDEPGWVTRLRDGITGLFRK